VESDQIPLENLRNSEVLHSEGLIKRLQGLILKILEIAIADMSE